MVFLDKTGLFDIKYQALQVLAFGMIDVDGMIGWLMQLVQDAHLATGNGSCGKYGHSELVLVDGLRTTESEEDATRLYLLKGLLIDSSIAL